MTWRFRMGCDAVVTSAPGIMMLTGGLLSGAFLDLLLITSFPAAVLVKRLARISMTNKHLHAGVPSFHPDDDAHFDHDDRRGGDVGRDWCGWQGAVYAGVVDDLLLLARLPGDTHPGCRRGPATIRKNKIYLISTSAAYLILFRTPLFQYLVHGFLITAIPICVLGSSLSFLCTMAKSWTFPDWNNKLSVIIQTKL